LFRGEARLQTRSRTNLAEIASNQVEYKYLSHLIANSGAPIDKAKPYFTKPDHVMDILEHWQGKGMAAWPLNPPLAAEAGNKIESKTYAKADDKFEVDTGLWKTGWGSNDGEMYGGRYDWKRLSNALTRPPKPDAVQVSIGALGDSAYEYLLKQYLISGRTEKRLLNMCKWFGFALFNIEQA
jgi:mannosyl-oligosaccharide alpha-1,2-mannosidase